MRASTRSAGPARVVSLAYAIGIVLGTLLLLLPISKVGPGSANVMEAAFTTISALCVTGLAIVDTATYWTGFGQAVILGEIAIGGFGIMALSALVAVFFANKIGLKARLSAASESGLAGLGSIRSILRRVFFITVGIEFLIGALLFVRFVTEYHMSVGKALWHALFHSVSAFNNAGFALYSDSLMSFVNDPWIQLPLDVAVLFGGLGFPVFIELFRAARHNLRRNQGNSGVREVWRWSLNARIVLWASAILVVLPTVFFALVEWANPGTFGGLSDGSKWLNAFSMAVQPRTAGFNSVDLAQAHPTSWLAMDILMFIGGASASTAGGIKIGTAAVLVFIVWTEIRGETAVNIGNRRLPRSIQRQALTLVLLAAMAIVAATFYLMLITKFGLDRILFEVLSAFATVGLTTGITTQLPAAALIVLMILMFIGRVGPMVVASALATRYSQKHFEYPKERPLIG
jgi:potassium uptake TrkH family protein